MFKALFLVLAFISFGALASNSINDAFSLLNLEPRKEVRGEFMQEKKIKVLKNKLKSSGHFSASENGFIWQQSTPVKSLMRMDDTGVYSKDHLGNEKPMPQAQQFIPLLQALLLQDTDSLANYLEYQSHNQECVVLTTKAPLDQVFSSLKVCGNGAISYLELNEKAGHRSEIMLTYAQ